MGIYILILHWRLAGESQEMAIIASSGTEFVWQTLVTSCLALGVAPCWPKLLNALVLQTNSLFSKTGNSTISLTSTPNLHVIRQRMSLHGMEASSHAASDFYSQLFANTALLPCNVMRTIISHTALLYKPAPIQIACLKVKFQESIQLVLAVSPSPPWNVMVNSLCTGVIQ